MDASMSQEIFTVLLAIMHNKALLLLLLQVYDHILQEWREGSLCHFMGYEQRKLCIMKQSQQKKETRDANESKLSQLENLYMLLTKTNQQLDIFQTHPK